MSIPVIKNKKSQANKSNKKASASKTVKKIEKLTSPDAAQEVSPKLSKSTFKITGATKTPFPDFISPMLSTLVVEIPQEGEWIYEIKWDGYRAISYCNKNDIKILSRNNKSFNDKFYPLVSALQMLNLQAVFDGEIVVLKNTGITSFSDLQNWRSEADGELAYYIFDILWLNGYSLMGLPLTKRKELLKGIFNSEGSIKESLSFSTSVSQFLEAAKKMGLEGMIAKRADSQYLPDYRGKDWLKIKVQNSQEAVIGGYTKNENSPNLFSAILVGVYDNGILNFTGKIGTGFNVEMQRELMNKFKPLIISKSPFIIEPDVNKPSRFRPNPPHADVVWLSPKLVCEVQFTEMTNDGVMRHPSFKGLREDKNEKTVHAEVPENSSRISNNLDLKIPSIKTAERKSLLNPSEDTQTKIIKNRELKFNHLSKVFWPKDGYTKRDLLNYYYQVAPYILPYLKNRPQSLNRFPNGID
ncbi:MAG: DNA ligase, partial [Parachlamydiaceae bacterium]|nr:DNA ligase [Parachlamydiaceae bacterium]